MSLAVTGVSESHVCPRVLAPLVLALVLVGLGLALPAGASTLGASGSPGWHTQKIRAAGAANPSAVSFISSTHGWVVGDSGSIIATTDGGASWSTEDSGYAGSDAILSSICFVDADHGWAVGSDDSGAVIVATADGGATWNSQDASAAGENAWLSSVSFVDADHGWAVGSSLDYDSGPALVILATTDGGATWDAQYAAPVKVLDSMEELNAVTFVSAERGWAVGDTGDAADESPIILATSNGGLSWKAERADARVYGGLYSVSFGDAKHGWAVGGAGGEQVGPPVILVTRDGGATWSAQKAPRVDSDSFLNAVSFVDAKRGWAVGDANRGYDVHGSPRYAPGILATRNGGATWRAQDATSAGAQGELWSVSFADTAHGWAVGISTPSSGDGGPVALATTNGGYLPRPSLAALKPTSAKRAAVVTITGKYFGVRRGTNFVKFGATTCKKYLSWSATRIRCRVPAKAKFGRLKVTVSTTSGISSAKVLTVRR